MQNDKQELFAIRCCSQPSPKVRQIYAALKMKEAPFVRKKSVVRKIEPNKSQKTQNKIDTS